MQSWPLDASFYAPSSCFNLLLHACRRLVSLQYSTDDKPDMKAGKFNGIPYPPELPIQAGTILPPASVSQDSPFTEAISWLSLLIYYLLSLRPPNNLGDSAYYSEPEPTSAITEPNIVQPIDLATSTLVAIASPTRSLFTVVIPTVDSSGHKEEQPLPTNALSSGDLASSDDLGHVGNVPAVAWESVNLPAVTWTP